MTAYNSKPASEAEPKDTTEEWQSVTNAVIRRKIQNRLNQRASRLRRTNRTDKGLVIRQWKAPVSVVQASAERQTPSDDDEVLIVRNTTPGVLILDKQSANPKSPTGGEALICEWRERVALQIVSEADSYIETYRRAIHRHVRQHNSYLENAEEGTSCETVYLPPHKEKQQDCLLTLPSDHLLSLIYYNVYRGLLHNIDILGLDRDQTCREICPSPFTPMSPNASSAVTRLPKDLQPTKLQISMDHHAFADLHPDPILRDNLLRRGEDNYDDYDLCHDLVGLSTNWDDYLVVEESVPRTGLILWDDPWNLESWEVTEPFAKKWDWVLKGAFELEACTNRRRKSRGWKPILFA